MQQVFDTLEKIFFTPIFGDLTLYSLLSVVLKFVFVLLVLVFISRIVKMISMDLRTTLKQSSERPVYLKLLNDPRTLDFPVRDEYYLLGETSIGRADDNRVIIKDPMLSKHQASILEQNGRYFIKDLGSTNPTLVNQIAIKQPTELFSHDLISLGRVDFIFINAADEEADNE